MQKSQPQIHTGQIEQVIVPGEIAEIPVQGFCLDVGKPPLPAGTAFPPIGEWIPPVPDNEQVAVPTSPEPINPVTPKDDEDAVPTSPEPINPGRYATIRNELPASFKPVKDRKPRPRPEPVPPDEMNPAAPDWNLTFPGTDKPFNYTINISEHPEDAAQIIFPMVENITGAYDELQQNGEIQTPFTSDENRQREAVIQQTIWMATSVLQDQQYGKEEFAGRMKQQFEEASGTKIKEAPEQRQEQFNQGIDQFWGTFELVGEKAKVLKKETVSKQEDKESGQCEMICPQNHSWVDAENVCFEWNCTENSEGPFDLTLISEMGSELNYSDIEGNQFSLDEPLIPGMNYKAVLSYSTSLGILEGPSVLFNVNPNCMAELQDVMAKLDSLRQQLENAQNELEGNPLVAEARLIDMVMEIL